jgi:predicted  nucleic acid-binding Zn-ribbon protein
MSFLTHLQCTRCGKTYSADALRTTCPEDGKPLYARYDLEAVGRAVRLERQKLPLKPPYEMQIRESLRDNQNGRRATVTEEAAGTHARRPLDG